MGGRGCADVVVVGSGCAGMRAALELARAGLRVVVVEKSRSYGGTSIRSGGVVHAAGTGLQRRMGVEDAPQDMARLLVLAGEGEVDEGLVFDMCAHSAGHVEFLEGLGVEFNELQSMAHLPYEGADGLVKPRLHACSAGSRKMFRALHAATVRAGVRYMYGARAFKLLRDRDGAVVGIEATGDFKDMGHAGTDDGVGAAWMRAQGFDSDGATAADGMPALAAPPQATGVAPDASVAIRAARGVVLATGGVDQGADLLAKLNPQQLWDIESQVSLTSGDNTGDGVRMALEAGAGLRGFGGAIDLTGRLLAGVSASASMMAAVFVDTAGRRFVCEDCSYSYVARAVYERTVLTGKPCFTVFGARSLPYMSYSADSLSDEVATGTAWRGGTVEELAAAAGIDARGLARTLESWNACVGRRGDPLGRVTGLAPILPPYYAFVEGSMNLGGLGGVAIDAGARVLDADGRAIRGLYAAGMCTGGWIGPYYPASGIALLGALHWSWRAAQTITGDDG